MSRWMTLLLLGACAPSGEDANLTSYNATIRWTEHGVPHIRGDDFGSVAYGHGYAFARDHLCILQEQLLKVRGERARWFGPGDDGAILDEDVGWRALDPVGQAAVAWGALPDKQAAVLAGFAAGIDRWMEDNAAPEPCADAGWVRPLVGEDILTYALALGLDGSGAVFVTDIGRAAPPGRSSRRPRGKERMQELADALHSPRLGSNGWAVGGDRSENGKGLLLSNTHFPSVGEKQWFEAHLTVTGELDVYGASLIGVPLINVGFNEHIAWTHTVSYTPRFVAYALTLDPADPTRYAYDGGFRSMTPTEHRVEVLGEDGAVSTVTRTTWRSHYGPVIDAPVVGWSPGLAITFRDVNDANTGMFEVWEAMNVADDLDALRAAHEIQGIPWVYTLAADDQGEAWFADTSRAPNLSPAAIDAWRALQAGGTLTGLLASQFAAFGALLVDGADPINAWVDDPAAALPGLVPLAEAPALTTRTYVFNANDSHWLTNAETPLEGYNTVIFGPERTARSARTRMNARYLSETGEGSASGADGRFSLAEIEAGAMSMRSSLAEVALAAVVARCGGRTVVDLGRGRGEVDVSALCSVLSDWDGRYTVESAGPVVWRELLASGEFDLADLNDGGGGLFLTPFDPGDPMGTPRDVIPQPAPAPDGETDPVRRALAVAAVRLGELGEGLPTLGEAQRMLFEDGAKVGVPGGQYWEGTIGVSEWWPGGTTTLLPQPAQPALINEATSLSADGWWVNDGNSFMLAVSFTDSGPAARAVMTYGQSDVATSPYLHDQAEIYAGGAMREVWFREADVDAHAVETLELRSGE